MDIINIIIVIAFLVFLAFEGKEAFLRYRDMKAEMKKIHETKTNIEICKDYVVTIIAYGLFGLFILAYGIYFVMSTSYLFGAVFIVLSLYCLVFILEAIVTKTFIFFDSGFSVSGRVYKYKSVLKIDEKKKFIRGFQVKVIGDDEVYVTKKAKPILEERLKEHKNRKRK